LESLTGEDQELWVRMMASQSSGGQESSSSSLTQSRQFNHEDILVDTFESQSKDQTSAFTHLTNKLLVSHKPEANSAIDQNDQNCNKPWKPFTLRAPTIIASLFSTFALMVLIEYINKVTIEEKALFCAG